MRILNNLCIINSRNKKEVKTRKCPNKLKENASVASSSSSSSKGRMVLFQAVFKSLGR
jgi:hypothetical protein